MIDVRINRKSKHTGCIIIYTHTYKYFLEVYGLNDHYHFVNRCHSRVLFINFKEFGNYSCRINENIKEAHVVHILSRGSLLPNFAPHSTIEEFGSG